MDHHKPASSKIPHALALHIGFSGSRDLGFSDLPDAEIARREGLLVAALKAELIGLTQRFGLHAGYFPVALSQLAIGADSVFAEACKQSNTLHRIFLPQPRDSYLSAKGSKGPDFSDAQIARAQAQFAYPNVIQERVVSSASDRGTRLRECSFEILRLADIAITLQPKAATTGGKPGGTQDFLNGARRHGKPVLVCEFAFDADGELAWDPQRMTDANADHGAKLPALPDIFATALPREGFIHAIKTEASALSKRLRQQFERRMHQVIYAHVGATALASAALAMAYSVPNKTTLIWSVTIALLIAEVGLLVWGWWTHEKLHSDENTKRWATARLAAEIARSAETLGPEKIVAGAQAPQPAFAGQHTYLRALFDIPLPGDLRDLARTINVVHLDVTRPNKDEKWELLRDRYIRERLDTPDKNRGQIPYFTAELASAKRTVKRAHWRFHFYVAVAVLATIVKLALTAYGVSVSGIAALLSWLAIVAPVFAVAVMSIMANLDRQARESTYRDVLDFLTKQRSLLRAAETEPEFLRLQAECEVKLLSEAVNWYYRRRFVNPA